MTAPFSLGADLVDVARIRRLVRDKRFLRRVFTPEEVRYCRSKKHFAQHFAVRFAAKEAVWKAFAAVEGLRGVGHRDIGVGRRDGGPPFVVLSRRLKKFEKRFSLTLSHTHEYAMAVVLYRAKA